MQEMALDHNHQQMPISRRGLLILIVFHLEGIKILSMVLDLSLKIQLLVQTMALVHFKMKEIFLLPDKTSSLKPQTPIKPL